MAVTREKPGIFLVVVLTMLLLVFEEAIYGRLPLPPIAYVGLKSMSELFLYLLLMIVIMARMLSDRVPPYHPTRFDLFLLAFVGFALISTLINKGGLFESILNLRAMLRYVSIYYIIVLMNWVPSKRQLMLLLKIIVAVGVFQALLGLFQSGMGKEFTDAWFSATKSELSKGNLLTFLDTTRKLGAGIGTLGKPAPYSLYLILCGVVILAVILGLGRKVQWKWWLGFLVILGGIYISYKRGPLMLAFFLPFLVAWLTGSRNLLKLYAIAALAGVLVFQAYLQSRDFTGLVKEKEVQISPLESLTHLFSREYWEKTSRVSRGWMILEVGPEALSSMKLIGYGADEQHVKEELARKGGNFTRLVGYGAFEDVYLVALLIYYGPVGVLILLLAFFDLFLKASRLKSGPCGTYRIVGVTLMALLLMMIATSFLERVLELRAFAFTFWVFAGITVVALRRCRELGEGAPETGSTETAAGAVPQ